MRLSTKRKLFVVYYLGKAKGNATLAARLAGFGSPGMAGSRMMKNDEIRAAIAERLDKAAMSEEEVLVRLSGLAATDMGDFLKFNPDASPDELPALDLRRARRRDRLGNIRKLKRVTRTLFSGKDQEPETETTVELELHDPHKALSLLARYHGLTEPGEDSGDTITADRVRRLAQLREDRAKRNAHVASG